MLWQVPLRTHLYSGFFPSPWGVDEQLGTCALERGPACPSLCTSVLWLSGEEAARGHHRGGVLNVEHRVENVLEMGIALLPWHVLPPL